MAYVSPNYQTKKALKDAIKEGKIVEVYSPGPFPAKQNGREYIEGPHGVHRWYAQVQVEEGLVTKVIS